MGLMLRDLRRSIEEKRKPHLNLLVLFDELALQDGHLELI
jgi:hypothetical protein